MKLFILKDKSERMFAFEIFNIFLGRKGAVRIIKKIANIKIIEDSKKFSVDNESGFCEFELEGQRFVIEEPFGDNSRYWIGSKSSHPTSQIEIIAEYFKKQKLPFGFGK